MSPSSALFSTGNWRFGLNSTAVQGMNQQFPFSAYGIRYNNNPFINHNGLVLTTGSDSVSKNIAINPAEFIYASDFESIERLKSFDDITADFDVRSSFQEKEALDPSLGIRIRQRILGWDDQEAAQFLMMEYELQNRSGQNYDSLYFNLFTQWSLVDEATNTVKYDAANKMAYAYDATNSLYGGMALVTEIDSVFFPINIGALNGHISDLTNDTITNELIYRASKESFSRMAAGENAGGNIVASFSGVLLKDFEAAEHQLVRYIMLAGNSLTDLQNNLLIAKARMATIDNNRPFGAQLLACKGDSPTFRTAGLDSMHIYLTPTSNTIAYSGRNFPVGEVIKDSTFYYEMIDGAGFTDMRKRLVVQLVKPVAEFPVQALPYLLSAEETTLIQFTDSSTQAVEWLWEFSNGYQSTQRNPSVPFNEAGFFEVKLIVTNAAGCQDTVTKQIQTVFRSAQPKIDTAQLLCKGSDVLINDATISELSFYADPAATNLIYRGSNRGH